MPVQEHRSQSGKEEIQSFVDLDQNYKLCSFTSGLRSGWQRQGHDGRGKAAHGLEEIYVNKPCISFLETWDGWERVVLLHGDGKQPARQVSPCQLASDAGKEVALAFVAHHQNAALSGRDGEGLCEAREKMQGKPEEKQMRDVCTR